MFVIIKINTGSLKKLMKTMKKSPLHWKVLKAFKQIKPYYDLTIKGGIQSEGNSI